MGLGPQAHPVDVDYSEGAAVGYRWFAEKHLTPLFPFGYGLSYTTFGYSHLRVSGGRDLTVSFEVTNTGKTPGAAVPQVYLVARAGQRLQRLVGFSRVVLAPGQTQAVTLRTDPRLLADFDTKTHRWRIEGGDYTVALARSAGEPVITASARLDSGSFKP